jgi:hypothetical protein
MALGNRAMRMRISTATEETLNGSPVKGMLRNTSREENTSIPQINIYTSDNSS